MDICFQCFICSVWSEETVEKSVLEGSFGGSIYQKNLEGVPIYPGELAIIYMQSGLNDPSIFLPVSALVSGLWFFRTALLWRFLWTFFCSLVPCAIGGSPKFFHKLIFKCEQCPGMSSLCLIFLLVHDREGFNGLY